MSKKTKETKESSPKEEVKLIFKKENVWEKYLDKYEKEAFAFSEGYKEFLDESKTERETVKYVKTLLDKNSFIDMDEPEPKQVKGKGKKNANNYRGFYRIVHNKTMLIYISGENDLDHGLNIVGAHIDSPRIDLKPNPLYEDSGMSFFKTHYYGGIKKYQWTAIPLAIHGVFVKEDGEVVEINLGEKDTDPVFTITDLLPHLAADQMQKKLADGISGEDLNLLIGTIPEMNKEDGKDIKDKFKLNVLKILNKEYGIKEEDFVSSEIEIVPAFKARDVGFDRSMVGAYGQDDRICSYIALKALLDAQNLKHGCICYLSDKEEIGSVGNTGAQSNMFEDFLVDICHKIGYDYPVIATKRCYRVSRMISADVNAAYDPTFAGVFEKSNASFMGKGVVINKYTGSRGKSGASDANAEYVSLIRSIFNKNDIAWQAAELGKVDQGGGGTIALYFANKGINVIDSGVAILSMHSPFEVANKMDIFTTYRAYKAFYEY